MKLSMIIFVMLTGVQTSAQLQTPAAASLWNGVWKLNHSMSREGVVKLVILQKTDGTLHSSNGNAANAYDFICDGKQSSVYGPTVTCTSMSARSFELAFFVDGKRASTSRRVVSEDGTTMTVDTRTFRADGTSDHSIDTFRREASSAYNSNGIAMAGEWKRESTVRDTSVITVISISAGIMHVQLPGAQGHYDAMLDGTDAPQVGPNTPSGMTDSAKQISANVIRFMEKLNGKERNEGVETLSADGKILTIEEWTPGREADKVVLVFEKQ